MQPGKNFPRGVLLPPSPLLLSLPLLSSPVLLLLLSFHAGSPSYNGLIPDRMDSRVSFEDKIKSSSLRLTNDWFGRTKPCRPGNSNSHFLTTMEPGRTRPR